MHKLTREQIAEIRSNIRVYNPKLGRFVKGKGFSIPEITSVGLSPDIVRKMGLPVDKRRKTAHEHNKNLLLAIFGKERDMPSGAKGEEAQKIANIEDILVSIADELMDFLGSAKRRKISKVVDVFANSIREKLPQISISDNALGDAVRGILEDIARAGFGKLGKEFFNRSDEWDESVIREIIVERLNKLVEG